MPEDREPQRTAWHALPGESALERLDSSPEGLSNDEAQSRLQRYGPNRLQQAQGRPWWRRLLEQFNNILMMILIVAAAASLVLGHTLDAFAILGVVIIIALIGFIQEGKAEQALESIRNLLSPRPMCCATASAVRCRPRSWSPAISS